jgi:hypothetical protein
MIGARNGDSHHFDAKSGVSSNTYEVKKVGSPFPRFSTHNPLLASPRPVGAWRGWTERALPTEGGAG